MIARSALARRAEGEYLALPGPICAGPQEREGSSQRATSEITNLQSDRGSDSDNNHPAHIMPGQ